MYLGAGRKDQTGVDLCLPRWRQFIEESDVIQKRTNVLCVINAGTYIQALIASFFRKGEGVGSFCSNGIAVSVKD